MDERWDFDAAAVRTVGRDASRRRCHLASDLRERPMARPCRLPDEVAGCIEPRLVELRSARREARSRREADLRAPALFLQRRHRQRSGPASRAHARASRHRRATHAALRRFRRLLPARASAVRRGRRLGCRNRGLSGRALRPVRAFAACVDRVGSPKIISCRWRESRREQVVRLRDAGLPTMTALARAAPETDVPRIARHSFETLRDQAALQVERRTTGRLDWHAIACDPGRGFELLPPPSSGDVIFDIEGDPFWEPAQGLHFLFGLLLREGADWRYRPIWAHDRRGERADVRTVRRSGARATGCRSANACVSLRYLRERGAQAAHGHLRHARRRGGRAAAAERLHQSAHGGAPGPSGRRRQLLVERDRSARGVRATGRRQDSGWTPCWRTRSGSSPKTRRCLRRSPTTTRKTAARRLRYETGSSSTIPRTSAVGGASSQRRSKTEQDDGERDALRQRLVEGEEPGSVRWLAGELLEYHRREARPAWWWYLRAPRPDDRRGAARRRRSDQRSRADRRGGSRQEVAHSYAAVSGAAAQVVAGRHAS